MGMPSLLIRLILLVGLGTVEAQLATWQQPTPGCNPTNDQAQCCVQSILPAYLGRPFNFTVQALGKTTPTAAPATITLLAGSVQNGGVETSSCCGFANLLATQSAVTASPATSPAVRPTVWNLPSADMITEDTIPTSYCLTYQASWTGGNFACLKTICPKICVEPVFVLAGRMLSTPNWGTQASSCGVGQNGGSGVSCLQLAAEQPNPNKILAYLQMSNQATLVDPLDSSSVGVRVGQQVTFTIGVINFDAAGATEIMVVDDPGVPVGMVFGPPSTQCSGGVELCRLVTWTPRAHDAGKVVQVRLRARNNAGGVCGHVYSKELIIEIPVTRPVATWEQPDADRTKDIAVGGLYTQVFSCRSNNYAGKVDFLNVTIDGELEAEGLLAGALVSDQGSLVTQAGSQNNVEFRFVSTARDAGRVKKWCFGCGDVTNVMAKQVRCISMETRLCEYAVRDGDTLQSLARRHHLNTNWLRMWNANPALSDPDTTLSEDLLLGVTSNSADDKIQQGFAVRVGSVYTIKHGDTINLIAARFETTVKKLLVVNPKLADLLDKDEDNIQPGMDLCIMTCTDKLSDKKSWSMLSWACTHCD